MTRFSRFSALWASFPQAKLSIAVALLVCSSHIIHAQGQDAEVLSAAIAHYSNARSNRSEPPLLVIAAETIEADRISLGRFERTQSHELTGSITRQLRERNTRAQTVGEIRLPANAMLVRNALSMTRHITPTGTEVADWSPFAHAYPGSLLLQLAAPVYFEPGRKALVYFWAGIGPEGTQGWLYILEKRGDAWQVTWSESPWIT